MQCVRAGVHGPHSCWLAKCCATLARPTRRCCQRQRIFPGVHGVHASWPALSSAVLARAVRRCPLELLCPAPTCSTRRVMARDPNDGISAHATVLRDLLCMSRVAHHHAPAYTCISHARIQAHEIIQHMHNLPVNFVAPALPGRRQHASRKPLRISCACCQPDKASRELSHTKQATSRGDTWRMRQRQRGSCGAD